MTREEKKIEILKAAGKVFLTRGFERTKIDEVAKEAGIGKGTVYEYFASKQHLFEETINYSNKMMIDGLKEKMDPEKCFADNFKTFVEYMTNTITEHLRIFDLMANSEIMAKEMGAAMVESNLRLSDILSEQIQHAVARGELRSDLDTRLIIVIMTGTVYQCCCEKMMTCEQNGQGINYDQLIDAVMQGIGSR